MEYQYKPPTLYCGYLKRYCLKHFLKHSDTLFMCVNYKLHTVFVALLWVKIYIQECFIQSIQSTGSYSQMMCCCIVLYQLFILKNRVKLKRDACMLVPYCKIWNISPWAYAKISSHFGLGTSIPYEFIYTPYGLIFHILQYYRIIQYNRHMNSM